MYEKRTVTKYLVENPIFIKNTFDEPALVSQYFPVCSWKLRLQMVILSMIFVREFLSGFIFYREHANRIKFIKSDFWGFNKEKIPPFEVWWRFGKILAQNISWIDLHC